MPRKFREISYPEQQHDNVLIDLHATDGGNFTHSVSVCPNNEFSGKSGGLVFDIEPENEVPASCTLRFSFNTR